MFDKLVWQPDRILLGDLVFRLVHPRSNDWDGGDHFLFYKNRELVDQYQAFFARYSGYHPTRIMELGIYDGGSTALWYELFRPDKLVAVDLKDRTDSPYFKRYLESRGLRDRILTFWQTNQADKAHLRALASQHLGGQLDLVIDDASHLYAPSRASFEALFPLCVPGGIYIIEDWAWDHWPAFSAPNHRWANEERMTRLVIELIEAAGSSTQLISSITIHQGFVAVERGPLPLSQTNGFNLDDHIVRRPARHHPGFVERLWKALKQKRGNRSG